jgi:hypothetical protein
MAEIAFIDRPLYQTLPNLLDVSEKDPVDQSNHLKYSDLSIETPTWSVISAGIDLPQQSIPETYSPNHVRASMSTFN